MWRREVCKMSKQKGIIKAIAMIAFAILTVSIAVICFCFNEDYLYQVEVKDVEFKGEDFKKSCFSVGSDYIYICAFSKDESDYYIAKTPINGNDLETLSYKIPENMKVLSLSADSSGECSVLLSTFHEEPFEGENAILIDYQITRIDRIDTDGKLKYSLDVSDEFRKSELMPVIFEADACDNYYVNNGSVLMHFSRNSNKVEKFIVDGYYETVMCDDDKAYAVYWDNSSEKTILTAINDGEIKRVAELETFNEDYSSISKSGEDLYLYNRDGLYKFSNNTQECLYKDDNIKETKRFIDGEDLSTEGELCILLNKDYKYSVRHIKIRNT